MLTVTTYPPDAKLDKDTLVSLFEKPVDGTIVIGDSSRHVVLYRADDIVGDVVAKHADEIFQRNYAENLSAYDFFHGHFFVNRNCKPKEIDIWTPEKGNHKQVRLYADLPKTLTKDEWLEFFLSSDPHFFYHTRENIGPRRPYSGSPRSLIGDINGHVYPLTSNDECFVTHGSVSGDEEFEFDGKHYNGMGRFDSDVTLVLDDGQPFSINMSQFYLLAGESGRYKIPSGQNFDTYYELRRPGMDPR